MRLLVLITLLTASAHAGEWLHLPAGGGDQRQVTSGVVLAPGDALLLRPSEPSGTTSRVLVFESFTTTPPKWFSLRPLRQDGPPLRVVSLPPPGHSEAWTRQRIRVEGLPATWRELRLDFGLPPGGALQIRNLEWRPERPGEFDQTEVRPSSVSDKLIDDELSRNYPASISRVEIRERDVLISGHVENTDSVPLLAEIPMDRLLDDPSRFEVLLPIATETGGAFEIKVPRVRQRSGLSYDRLISRWRIVTKRDGIITPLSHARYPDEVVCANPAGPHPATRNKKGLGGWHLGRLPNELADLGIQAVTVNLTVDTLLSDRASPDTITFSWQGRTYHARRGTLERFDATFLKAAENDVLVSVILLVGNAERSPGKTRLLAHPDADPQGTYAMPDLVSEDGIGTYGALLNLMAERWSRPDGKHGRVHHWIVHNEVDAGWTWTNAGKLPALSYMDLYQRSLRLTDLIVRQYDPHARAFISLTHHWAEAGSPKYYGSRQMLELLARFTAAEGDFPWALAHHPYPQDLRNPRTWQDDKVNFTFDTPKITPRNIEVLDAWMKGPAMLYRGKVRPVHLSENGFNSPDYSEKSLNEQAAGMAYAWKKIQSLDSIQVWHYHNWIDNRNEGGLRLGLRRFPDAPGAPLQPKPIWHLYRALGTARENEACAPYLDTIGFREWSSIIRRKLIN